MVNNNPQISSAETRENLEIEVKSEKTVNNAGNALIRTSSWRQVWITCDSWLKITNKKHLRSVNWTGRAPKRENETCQNKEGLPTWKTLFRFMREELFTLCYWKKFTALTTSLSLGFMSNEFLRVRKNSLKKCYIFGAVCKCKLTSMNTSPWRNPGSWDYNAQSTKVREQNSFSCSRALLWRLLTNSAKMRTAASPCYKANVSRILLTFLWQANSLTFPQNRLHWKLPPTLWFGITRRFWFCQPVWNKETAGENKTANMLWQTGF